MWLTLEAHLLAALEIWVNPNKPNEIAEYSYSCWASTDDSDIFAMPACTMTEEAKAYYSYYTEVLAFCDASHPIVADCLMLAAGTTGVLFLSVIVAPCVTRPHVRRQREHLGTGLRTRRYAAVMDLLGVPRAGRMDVHIRSGAETPRIASPLAIT